MRLDLEAGTLIPIPGVKIGLAGTRHFGMFGSASRRQLFQRVFAFGADALEESRCRDRAYQDAGFINRQVEHWRAVEVETMISGVWE